MCLDKIAEYLEREGWRRQVAGNENFFAAIKAINAMVWSGKGLIVSGEYGCGKTALVNAVAKAFGEPVFTVRLSCSSDLEKLEKDWQSYFGVNPLQQNVFLDDLGAESMTNEFGVRFERAADFILEYHAFKDERVRLFITTNLTTAEIDARYGGRLLSRLKDLCVPLRLAGDDHRNWTLP